jgi:murein DD-endopeptidase MepM/ murein hydrolase activator NlpD
MWLRTFIILSLAACVGDAPPDPGPGADDTDESSATATIAATVGTQARVVNTGGLGLRLRSAADPNSTVILVMPEGAIVQVIAGPAGPWFKVTYQTVTGWAHGDYLRTRTGGANNLLPWTANVSFPITQGHNGGSHTGKAQWAWDIGMPVGTPVRAAHFGTIRLIKNGSTSGGCSSAFAEMANYVIVDQGNGYESLYLHLSKLAVSQGQAVERGDIIGYSGQTGWACGPHLHFQIQLSPTNGGGTGYYNQTIHDYFYDPGFAFDPAVGTTVTSKNGVSDQP